MTADRIPVPANWRLLAPTAASIAALAWLVGFPVQPMLLGLMLFAATALVAWRPVVLFTLAPAALPLLDLAPWSGRNGLDEFDMLLALTCALSWSRLPRPVAVPANSRAAALIMGLMLVLAIGTGRALWPWPGWATHSFEPPLSAFNALHVGKGAGWALVLWGLAQRWQAAGADVSGAFGRGMVLGLTGCVLCVLAERLAFSGLADFAGDYRVAGPIAAMSLGGAYIECYLAVATPFLLVRLLPPAPAWKQLSGAVLLAGATYALAVTFSRGGFAAMAVAVTVVLLAALLPTARRGQGVLVGAALAGLAAAVAYPVVSGSFAQSRLKGTAADLGVRERHWAESLEAMDGSPPTKWLGMGLGTYAISSFWHSSPDRRPGGHQLLPDGHGGRLLRLGTGSGYYVEQIVPVQPGARYRLTSQMRQADAATAATWMLCQKWIIASLDCSRASGVSAVGAVSVDGWRTLTQDLIAPAAGPGLLPRMVRLSVHNPGSTPLDIAQVSLEDAVGTDLVRNGSFDAGMDRWTVTSDQHLAWHTKSLPIHLLFELGVLGVVVFAALLLAGASRAAQAARAGHACGASLLAALCAFSTVGLIDTLIDVPRFLMLWLLLCLLPHLLPRGRAVNPR